MGWLDAQLTSLVLCCQEEVSNEWLLEKKTPNGIEPVSSGRMREVPPVICLDYSTRATPKVEKKKELT